MEAQIPENFPANLYPQIKIERIQNPNRFYAIPVVGGVVKFFMLIPVGIDFFAIGIAVGALLLINSFVVLFTGKYWKPCFDLTLGFMRFSLKISYFWRGLTNKYPGFDMQIHDNFTLNMEMQKNPNRLFAIPIVGGLARFVLLIPYFIYSSVIQSGANIATIASSFVVLFNGVYPETTFELNRDSVRLSQSTTAYISGFSDNYPNFWISMNHKSMKIVLIILGAIWFIFSNASRFNQKRSTNNYSNNYYQNIQHYQSPTPASIKTY